MKRNAKRSIYVRIFSVFLATYMVLMIGFSAILIFMEKKTVEKELILYSNNINSNVEDILRDNIDSENNITDLSKVKKGFLKISNVFNAIEAEIAVFTDKYELILNTNNYWTVQYTIIEGNSHKTSYGSLNPEDWFSEEEIKELKNYLCADTKAEKVKVGDLHRYALDIDGLWMDNEMVIPEKIYVTPIYAESLDENGNILSAGGERRNDLVYRSGYENTKDLPYFEYGSILPAYNDNLYNENQEVLRQMVTDESNLINYLQQVLKKLPTSINPVERVSMLTYRYYLVVPYQNTYRILEDRSLYSEFYTAVGIDIDIWERISSTLIYVWTACLIIFFIAAYILSKQTYKTYLKQEELERQRTEMTDALAHDLKTPLSIISGYAQNLQEDVHTEKREHYAGHITANVNRMDKIIRKMLEMSRLESDSLEVRFEEISLNDICTETINRYKQVCDEKFITASTGGDAVIKADKSLIERVIDNFVINAIDNTPEGGRISMRILENTLEVFNSGSHIPEDKINEIWFPYKKCNTERSNTKGTGLGLSISRTILELHKFSYGAKNTEDGVIFWFKF